MTTTSNRMRWATPADAQHISAYYYACFVAAYGPQLSEQDLADAKPTATHWDGWLNDKPGVRTVVAIGADDEPLGHTTVRDNQVVHLFVDPSYHRQGIGRDMLAVAERLIRQDGHPQAELHTRVGNHPAIGLYQSCGWTMTEELTDNELPNGSMSPEHVMRKTFTARSHVDANRADWNAAAPNWIERGRRSWAAEPHWGEMAIPESELLVMPPVVGRDVVELGCGTGYVSAWCLRGGARSVVGIDNSPEQLRSAQALQAEFDQHFPLVWANAERLPIADNQFDVAINEYGAALWCDPELWIAEAARVLRPGGSLMFLSRSALLAMCAPSFEHERTSTQLLHPQRDLGQVTYPDTDGVEFARSPSGWIQLLTNNGFVVDRLAELYPPADGPERYSYYDASWARQWPAEEVWCATLR